MESAQTFQCMVCNKDFSVPEAALKKFPNWKPKTCLNCRDAKNPKKKWSGARPKKGPELNLTLDEVLTRFSDGPKEGLFTDGSATPNPGPGGWGVVYVVDNEVIDQMHGNDPHTTNNRMELRALIEAYKIGPRNVELSIWTDSQLCVKTMLEWAAAWEKRGWRRKGGPIKNLELVQELYALVQEKPNLKLRWIKAHDGSRWNEYADSLSTAYGRDRL